MDTPAGEIVAHRPETAQIQTLLEHQLDGLGLAIN
jgi:hypothetical protein